MQDVERPPGSKDTTPTPGTPGSPEETPASQKPDGSAGESEAEGAESEGELDGKKGAAESGKRKGRSDTDGDEPDPASKPASKRPASKRGVRAKKNRKRTSVVINSDGEDAKASRYKSVSTSTLHTSWDHSILDLIRKEFQLALLARDGFPAKVSSLIRPTSVNHVVRMCTYFVRISIMGDIFDQKYYPICTFAHCTYQ